MTHLTCHKNSKYIYMGGRIDRYVKPFAPADKAGCEYAYLEMLSYASPATGKKRSA
jgi:hypothetical protein